MKLRILANVCLLVLLGAPLTAQSVHVSAAGIDNEYVTLYSVTVENPRLSAKGRRTGSGDFLRFGFYLENFSTQTLAAVSVSAHVFDQDGAPVGVHSLLVVNDLAPGARTYRREVTDQLATIPGDRIVLLVDGIYGADGRQLWELPEESRADVRHDAVLPYLEVTEWLGFWKAAAGTPEACVLLCDSREASCRTTCGENGVQSFNCTLQADGTCTTSCTCYPPGGPRPSM